MRPRVEWITRADDYILELLESTDMALTPRVLAFNLDYSRRYIGDRCRLLLEADLVQKVGEKQGFYRISDKGRAYLRGELTPDELKNPG